MFIATSTNLFQRHPLSVLELWIEPFRGLGKKSQEEYATRAGVEGTISQAVFSLETRRTRYRGLAKTHLQHVVMAAAINVQRIIDWL